MARSVPLLRRLLAPAISRGRSFARDERGVTVIEFAILALPFFTLIFAIIETAMVFFASQVLDSALEDASRMVRTGRAQAANYTMTEFRSYLCGYTFNLLDCSQIRLKVTVISNFSSAAPPGDRMCQRRQRDAHALQLRVQPTMVLPCVASPARSEGWAEARARC